MEQPLVTPLWICAPVGRGVANNDPGAVRVALAGTSPAGVDPRWQLSQFVPTGMCALGPIGDVGGCTMMRLTPKNDVPVIAGPWQVAQLLVMPAWLIWPLANVVAPTDAAPVEGISWAGIAFEWQASQTSDVGRCGGTRPALVLGVTPMKVPATTLAPWQIEQLPVIPAWLMRPPANVVAPPVAPVAGISIVGTLVWQVSQLSEAGMCGGDVNDDLICTPKKLDATDGAWHCAQLV